MRCHYEVLGIERDSGDDDIKKSYRKLALKYHPDKNLENKDEVTAIFRQIQQAYEVLSDPQERAWYDKHRDAILRGGLGQGDEYTDQSLDVYQYFNTSCYSGYGDDEQGFYAVYKDVFCRIAEEDADFQESQGSECEYPQFGDSKGSFEQVVGSFYAFWESFCTVKSYVWEEKYDTREAPNRQIRRLMEQDNKKLRDKAKRERNEEVRALVAFVKKRDKRVQAHKKKLEERAAEISKRAEDRKMRDRQDRLRKLDDYQETEWSGMGELENDLERLEATVAKTFGEENDYVEEEGESVEEETEELPVYYNDLFCIACNKAFKTEKAFENHEKSKKHKENVALIRVQMAEDNEEFLEESLGEENEEAEESVPKVKLSKKQKKKRKQQKVVQEAEQESPSEDLEELHSAGPCEVSGDNSDNQGLLPETNVSDVAITEDPVKPNTLPDSAIPLHDDNAIPPSEAATLISGLNITKDATKSPSSHLPCNTCGIEFPTRNKLFTHIKESGHALQVDSVQQSHSQQTGDKDKKGKKKKKGKR